MDDLDCHRELIPSIPGTLEEVKQDIAEFETGLDDGTLVVAPHEEVMKEMRKLIASL